MNIQPKIAFSNLAPLESSAILTRFGKFQALNPRAGRTWSWQQRNRGIQSTLLYLVSDLPSYTGVCLGISRISVAIHRKT